MEAPAVRGDLMESWRGFGQCRKRHELSVRIIHKQSILGESVSGRDVLIYSMGDAR